MTSIVLGQALVPDGWAQNVRLTFADGVIQAVGPAGERVPGETRCAIGLPGLPNLHSHAFQRGMAGLSEARGSAEDDFWSWREVMYLFLDRMRAEDVEAVAAYGYVEMLESGFTRVGEFHYLHHQPDGTPYADLAETAARIAAAAMDTGIGLTLLPCFYAHGGFGGAPPTAGQRRFLNDPGRFARLLEATERILATVPGAVLGVAPHSLRAVTEAELTAVTKLRPGMPVHIHASEQMREVEASLAWSGQRPVEWLLDHAAIDASWCLVHATHMTPSETARLAASGAVAGLCPITEANLGDGIFDALGWQEAGGRFGVGSDSNVLIGAAAELRQLEYSQRLARRGRNVLAAGEGRSTGRSLFDAVLRGGSQALGVAPGGLQPGAPADIVTLDTAGPGLAGQGGDTVLDSWIFAGAPAQVDGVWVRGRQVVSGGQHVDRARIGSAYNQAVRRLAA